MTSMRPSKVVFLALWLSTACTRPDEPPLELNWPAARDAIRSVVLERAGRGALARADGWVYTVDVAQLLDAAARMGDEELYSTLHPIATRALVEWQHAAYVRGFVAWRTKEGSPPDASGTTEALRLAQALWRGSNVFARPEDRSAAMEIVEGYRRHSYVDQGVWLIRNYYNLETNAFATNSFLVDYDPDFLREVADEEQDYSELASQVDRLVQAALTPLGFVHELVQPEILTAMPLMGSAIYSPNNKAQLSNSCAVLERSMHIARGHGEKLLRFANERSEGLGLIFDVETGERHTDSYGGVETYGCLTRLGHRLALAELTLPFEPKLAWFVQDFVENEKQPLAFMASELLLTAAVVLGKGAT